MAVPASVALPEMNFRREISFVNISIVKINYHAGQFFSSIFMSYEKYYSFVTKL
jgi:hypothetical protein